MVVLVVLADTGHVCYDWYVELLQDLGVTDARAFEDLWRSESTGCDYDQLSSFNNGVGWLGQRYGGLVLLVGLVFDSNCFWWGRLVEEDANNLGVQEDVQVGMLSILQKRMNITVSCILSFTVGANISLPYLDIDQLNSTTFKMEITYRETSISLQILQVFNVVKAHFLNSVYKLISTFASVSTIRDVNRTIVTMLALVVSFAFGVICLKFVAHRQHILRGPAFSLPRVEINTLSTGIHHEVDRGTTTKHTSHRDDCFTAIEVLGSFGFVELEKVRNYEIF